MKKLLIILLAIILTGIIGILITIAIAMGLSHLIEKYKSQAPRCRNTIAENTEPVPAYKERLINPDDIDIQEVEDVDKFLKAHKFTIVDTPIREAILSGTAEESKPYVQAIFDQDSQFLEESKIPFVTSKNESIDTVMTKDISVEDILSNESIYFKSIKKPNTFDGELWDYTIFHGATWDYKETNFRSFDSHSFPDNVDMAIPSPKHIYLYYQGVGDSPRLFFVYDDIAIKYYKSEPDAASRVFISHDLDQNNPSAIAGAIEYFKYACIALNRNLNEYERNN